MDLFEILMRSEFVNKELPEEEKRKVLDGDVSIENLAKNFEKFNNIIVLVGAGASTNAGIPDFRTKGTGLYDNLESYGLEEPEDIFNIDFFKHNPIPFYTLAKTLIPEKKKYEPTTTHRFLKLLETKKKLLRIYTQNIDGLELQAGLDPKNVIFCHGNFMKCKCTKCGSEYSLKKFKKKLYADDLPIKCEKLFKKGKITKQKNCEGFIKPNIVFFGESLPSRFHSNVGKDFKKCDLLICIGSSLVVQPVGGLVHEVKKRVPRLLINMEKVSVWEEYEEEEEEGEEEKKEEKDKKEKEEDNDEETKLKNYRDVTLLGDCDKSVLKLAKLLEWELK